jgi:hypothetical protein
MVLPRVPTPFPKRLAAIAGVLVLAGSALLLPGAGFASVRASGPMAKPAPAAALPPKTCGAATTYNSAAYSLTAKACLQAVNDPMGYVMVYVTAEVKFTRGDTPVSYCRVEFDGVKGTLGDVPDGGADLSARCTRAAATGTLFVNTAPNGYSLGYENPFTGGTYTGRVTVLIGTDKGTVRNVVATYTTNIGT